MSGSSSNDHLPGPPQGPKHHEDDDEVETGQNAPQKKAGAEQKPVSQPLSATPAGQDPPRGGLFVNIKGKAGSINDLPASDAILTRTMGGPVEWQHVVRVDDLAVRQKLAEILKGGDAQIRCEWRPLALPPPPGQPPVGAPAHTCKVVAMKVQCQHHRQPGPNRILEVVAKPRDRRRDRITLAATMQSQCDEHPTWQIEGLPGNVAPPTGTSTFFDVKQWEHGTDDGPISPRKAMPKEYTVRALACDGHVRPVTVRVFPSDYIAISVVKEKVIAHHGDEHQLLHLAGHEPLFHIEITNIEEEGQAGQSSKVGIPESLRHLKENLQGSLDAVRCINKVGNFIKDNISDTIHFALLTKLEGRLAATWREYADWRAFYAYEMWIGVTLLEALARAEWPPFDKLPPAIKKIVLRVGKACFYIQLKGSIAIEAHLALNEPKPKKPWSWLRALGRLGVEVGGELIVANADVLAVEIKAGTAFTLEAELEPPGFNIKWGIVWEGLTVGFFITFLSSISRNQTWQALDAYPFEKHLWSPFGGHGGHEGEDHGSGGEHGAGGGGAAGHGGSAAPAKSGGHGGH